MDWTVILYLVLGVLGIVVSTVLVPWLRTKLGTEKMAALEAFVEAAVAAAEQLFGSGAGEQKKTYALTVLSEQGIDITDPVVDTLIEAKVYNLNEEQKLTAEKAAE